MVGSMGALPMGPKDEFPCHSHLLTVTTIDLIFVAMGAFFFWQRPLLIQLPLRWPLNEADSEVSFMETVSE
jgi:hypothetical protein